MEQLVATAAAKENSGACCKRPQPQRPLSFPTSILQRFDHSTEPCPLTSSSKSRYSTPSATKNIKSSPVRVCRSTAENTSCAAAKPKYSKAIGNPSALLCLSLNQHSAPKSGSTAKNIASRVGCASARQKQT